MTDLETSLRSPRTVRQLELLALAVQSARDEGKPYASASALYEFAKERWGMEWRSVDQDIIELMKEGYIFFERSLAGIGDFQVNQAGFDAADEFNDFRSSARKRNKALRDLLLAWLYDERSKGNDSPQLDSFLKSKRALFYGSPFTDAELSDASLWLREEGYIAGSAAWGAGVVRPTLTSRGMSAVENDESVSAPIAGFGNTNYNVNVHNARGFNMAVGSAGATQTNTVTEINVNEARKVAEAFRSMIPVFGLPEDQLTEARSTSEELDAVLEADEPEPGKVRQLVNKATEVAALGSASGVVQAFVEMGQKFLETM